MEHTAEPWMLKEHHSGAICLKDQFIAQCCEPTSAANARRIVACVNACAGIPTDMLESTKDWEAAGVQTVESVMRQRDELLLALEDCLDDSREALGNYEQLYGEHYKQHRIIAQRETVANAERAIANAKGA